MASDPRKYIITDCGRGRQTSINNTTNRAKWYQNKNAGVGSAAGKIGDFELLNDIPGVDKVAKGLRVLSELSDTVRTTGVPMPNVDPVGFVSDAIGVASSAVAAVNSFNPGVANRFVDQAKNTFSKVTSGDFGFEDIPGAYQDLANLAKLADGILTSNPKAAEESETCFASPYASDLAYQFAPKFPFLFIVEFMLSDPTLRDAAIPKHLAHLVKTSSRPNVRFEYEEVNMYNFRTKVPKRSEFEPMTMSFIDDQQSYSLAALYSMWLRDMAPITRARPAGAPLYEESGMNFDPQPGEIRSSSIGEAPSGKKGLLSEIRLHHIHGYGAKISTFHFMNPKIEELQASDLDMATSEATQVQMQFSYDGLFVDPFIPMPAKRVEELTNIGRFPIIPDTTPPETSGASGNGGGFFEGLIDSATDAVAGAVLGAASSAINAVGDALSPTPTIPQDELNNLIGGNDDDD